MSILQKTGVLNPLEARAAKTEHAFVGAIQHLKTYPEFPDPEAKNSSL